MESAPYSKYNTVSDLTDYTIYKDMIIVPNGTVLTDEYLEYQLATLYTRPAETYTITDFKLTYDVITQNFTFNINNGYNIFTVSPDDILTVISGYQYPDNSYTIRYYNYYVNNSYVRDIISIVPLIYIASTLIFILFKKEER
jgi:predicted membrane-bound dolichyl-phosphate-mannose-protein mannosyltransferase